MDYEIRTVWHWKAVAGFVLVIALLCTAMMFLGNLIGQWPAFVVGLVLGGLAVLPFDLYHFENNGWPHKGEWRRW